MTQVVGGERLLDEQQVEGVELGEVLGVVERVGGVGVDLEEQLVAETFADRGDAVESRPGSIFSLMRT